MKKVFFSLLGKLISLFVKLNLCLKAYNLIYERSSQKWVNVFHQYVKLPNKDFVWNIHLRNGEMVQTLVKKDDYKTLQLALDYKWYSPGLSLIEEEIFLYYNREVLNLDIGANLGMRSLSALSLGIETIMFEPNPELVKLNEERCELNEFDNYSIIKKGISNENSTKEFFVDKSSYKSSFNQNETEFVETLRVESVTLDSFFSSEVGKSVYMKVDVEGHEKNVIIGGEKFIIENSPVSIIEINDKGDNFNFIHGFFEKLGHRTFALYADEFEGKILKEYTKDSGINMNNVADFMFTKDEGLIERLKKKGYC